MDQSTSVRAAAILRAALEQPPERREAFLRDAVGNDAGLRRAVEALAARQNISTVAPGTGGPSDSALSSAPTSPAESGMRIGAYRVEAVLGEGGMGIVYRATQSNPRRTVALKVIRPGLMTGKLLRRFELESQMLGRLRHAGIAQIYEAGTAETPDGPRPFFAMEYVQGRALTDYCAGRALGVRQRLGIFVKICEAVHHAHQQGLVHRDLKPGNILIDETGHPKILDFGVARATDADMQTATMNTDVGQLVGTVPYMSPEQITGDPTLIDTRSDVYTLGVILYELLAGHLPHDIAGKTIPEAVRVIGQEEPKPLSSISRVFRGDLQTIAGKALEKSKERRYQSATELAADVIRYLHDEPIVARPPSTLYQLRKFARRHRGLVAGLAGAAVILAAGVAATVWQAVRATRQAERATAVSEFLQDTLSSADPDDKGRDVKLADLLDDAAAQVSGRYASNPEIAASVQHALAKSYWALGLGTEALAQADAAVAGFAATDGANSSSTLGALLTRARALRELAQFDEAARAFQQLIRDHERFDGPDARTTRHAVEGLAWVYADQGKLPEAEATFKDHAERTARDKGPEDRESLRARRLVLNVVLEAGRAEEAEPKLLALYDTITGTLKPGDAEVTAVRETLQQLYRGQGDYARAIEFGRLDLGAYRTKYGPEHPRTLRYTTTFARTLIQGNQIDEARSLLRATLEIETRVLGEDHFDTLTAAAFLADACQNLGDLAEADTLRRRIAAARARLLGEDHAQTLIARTNLAYVLSDRGQYAESEAILLDLLARRERVFGPEHNEVGLTLSMLGLNAVRAGDGAKAEPLLRRCLAIREKLFPEGNGVRGVVMTVLGHSLVLQERYAEAEPLVVKGAEWVVNDPRSPRRNKREAVERVILLLDRTGRAEEARAWRERLSGL